MRCACRRGISFSILCALAAVRPASPKPNNGESAKSCTVSARSSSSISQSVAPRSTKLGGLISPTGHLDNKTAETMPLFAGKTQVCTQQQCEWHSLAGHHRNYTERRVGAIGVASRAASIRPSICRRRGVAYRRNIIARHLVNILHNARAARLVAAPFRGHNGPPLTWRTQSVLLFIVSSPSHVSKLPTHNFSINSAADVCMRRAKRRKIAFVRTFARPQIDFVWRNILRADQKGKQTGCFWWLYELKKLSIAAELHEISIIRNSTWFYSHIAQFNFFCIRLKSNLLSLFCSILRSIAKKELIATVYHIFSSLSCFEICTMAK